LGLLKPAISNRSAPGRLRKKYRQLKSVYNTAVPGIYPEERHEQQVRESRQKCSHAALIWREDGKVPRRENCFLI